MSTLNDYIRAAHVLATLRHTDTPPHGVGIIFEPARPIDTAEDATGPVTSPAGAMREAGEECQWEAKVRLGGGKWGNIVGVGDSPEAAAMSLFRGYASAHRAVDGRRAAALARMTDLEQRTTVGDVLKATLEEESRQRSVTCHPETREPDGYVTVSVDGEVLVGNRPLSAVNDVDVVLWAAQVVPVFLATGRRAPIPSQFQTRE